MSLSPPVRTHLATRWVVALCLLKIAIHLPLAHRYGYHGDELYFILCGQHPALGYVDHPPMVPWIAGLCDLLFGQSIVALRIPAILAGTLTVALSMETARLLGGKTYAQVLAGLTTIFAPIYLLACGMLNIPVVESLFWTLSSYCLLRALVLEESRAWLLVGVVSGLGLLTKHSLLLWGAGIAVGLVLTPARKHLRTPWPWLGGTIAFVIFLPNLIWQATHDWATLEFITGLSSTRPPDYAEFILSQWIYAGALALFVWIGAIIFLFTQRGANARPIAWMFMIAFVLLTVLNGKTYYLAPSFATVFACGGVAWEGWLSPKRKTLRGLSLTAVVVGGLIFAPIVVPVWPIEEADRYVTTIFGDLAKPTDFTAELHRQHGKRENTARIAELFQQIPESERTSTIVLNGAYSQASTINYLGKELGLPTAYAGHMTFYFWGPPPSSATSALAYGIPAETLEGLFESVTQHGVVGGPPTMPVEHNIPVYYCKNLRRPWTEVWPTLKTFNHRVPYD